MENWRNDNYYLDAVMRGSSLGKSIPPVFLGGWMQSGGERFGPPVIA